MKMQVRARIKDLLLRKKTDGSTPMLSKEEAEKLYARGMNPNTVYALEIEIEDEKKLK